MCVACGSETGWCPHCKSTSALVPDQNNLYRCGNAECQTLLQKCYNYSDMKVCTRCVEVNANGGFLAGVLCDCCQFNAVIPDLSLDGNLDKWARLEAAKRRLFYTLDLLHLPYGNAAQGFVPPLSFDFKGDSLPDRGQWRSMNDEEQVFTGHADGKITINIKEADPIELEIARVQLGERRRTVIRHFRHEIGHYYWEVFVNHKCENECMAIFGDHNNPAYQDALLRYYAEGPPANWADNCVSGYATMHPWEDFAETFALYLDMVATLDTANYFGMLAQPLDLTDFEAMLSGFIHTGLVMNEMTRDMGLVDYTPEVIVQPVHDKLLFIHGLVNNTV
ncbi:MAG: putative zinc-binding metallopeptidase [Pseudomonadota bacterium]